MKAAAVILAFCGIATVANGNSFGWSQDYYAYPAYKVSYGVSDKITGDHKQAFEVRDGPVTKGSYSFVQPDGILRIVKYIVTPKGGFQAQVINMGVAKHPAVFNFYHQHEQQQPLQEVVFKKPLKKVRKLGKHEKGRKLGWKDVGNKKA